MTTINTSKKQLVLVLMSGFFASALVGCNGDSSGSQNSADNNKPMSVPQYPMQYDFIKQVKQKEISTKNKRHKLKSKNGKSLQMLGDTLDTVTEATNFLNIFAVAVPEIGFITAPATFIEGIYSSDGLDTTLSDMANAINTIQGEISTIETQISNINTAIQATFTDQATSQYASAFSTYMTNESALSAANSGFYNGITNNNDGTWVPTDGLNLPTASLPAVDKYNGAVTFASILVNTITENMAGFTTTSDGTSFTITPVANNVAYNLTLQAHYQLFLTTTFNQPWGQSLESNVADSIRTYNAEVSSFYYEGLKQLQNIYIMQKTANILNYNLPNTATSSYNGPLYGLNSLYYINGADASESSNTQLFNSTQENLDQWLIGASNALFNNTMQYIISDTPWYSTSYLPSQQFTYPYGATTEVVSHYMNIVMPSTIKTSSLIPANPLDGGMPQIQTNTQNGLSNSNYVFYVESGLGNPYQYIPQYESAWENNTPVTIQTESTSIFATGPNGQGVFGYIANPGFFDGQNYQAWAVDGQGNIYPTAATNLANRCSNGGSSITPFTDGGTVNGNTYPAHTYGWSCPTNPNPAYIANNTTALLSEVYPSVSPGSQNGYMFFGLMDPINDAFTSVSGSGALSVISITGNNTIVNNFYEWWSTYPTADFNVVMNVGNYTFAPTLQVIPGLDHYEFGAQMYCGSNDPLCTIDPVTNNICVAGQVVGLNWINGGTFMFGAYVPGTNNQQHCYNS